jgi:2-furoyl-CoA dehydrogenase 2Fe-2S iron sulfur subunit
MDNQRHISKHEQAVCEIMVNGQPRAWRCEPRTTLLDFLRNQPGLSGTHAGCEHGVCGACTVLINGLPARACLAFAHQCSGQEVRTIEGMAKAEELTDLQQAFSRHHALQCGFCTAGILISAEYLLLQESEPSEQRVREALSAHLCRCTGYAGIVNAVLEVARLRAEKSRSGGA